MGSIASKKFILSGWRLTLEEVSNNVYEITLMDESFRQAGTKDHDLERGIRQCGEYAFDIERQVTKNWNKFLFESALIQLESEEITDKRYDAMGSGSWLIEINDKRIVADGNNNVLTKQSKVEADWVDNFSFEMKNLDYKQFLKTTLKKSP